MLFKYLSVLALGMSVVLADRVPEVKDNPKGSWVIIPPTSWIGDTSIVGEVVAYTNVDGTISMTMNVNGGKKTPIPGGPFNFHLHASAIPAGGNCTGAKGHLDPQNIGDDFVCDPKQPGDCQVGDLSGKHGSCATLPGCSKTYTDNYLSLTPGNNAYIGDKSIVIHYANKTRMACANFVKGGSTSAKLRKAKRADNPW